MLFNLSFIDPMTPVHEIMSSCKKTVTGLIAGEGLFVLLTIEVRGERFDQVLSGRHVCLMGFSDMRVQV